jgi:hypothetical protein
MNIIIHEDEDILPVIQKRVKCVIPNCRNVGRNNLGMCIKHSKEYKFDKPTECPVCFEALDNEKYPMIPCGHWVHYDCIINSANEKCCICRTKITLNREQKKKLNEVKNKFNKDKEEEERREIQRQVELENSLFSRNTRWIDNLSVESAFGSRSNISDRLENYLESSERDVTISLLRDMTTVSRTTVRNNATVLFELQSTLTRLNSTNVVVSRRVQRLFHGIMGLVESEIRNVISNEYT